jgi:hypothetical protein
VPVCATGRDRPETRGDPLTVIQSPSRTPQKQSSVHLARTATQAFGGRGRKLERKAADRTRSPHEMLTIGGRTIVETQITFAATDVRCSQSGSTKNRLTTITFQATPRLRLQGLEGRNTIPDIIRVGKPSPVLEVQCSAPSFISLLGGNVVSRTGALARIRKRCPCAPSLI